jgi:hypothetical protein
VAASVLSLALAVGAAPSIGEQLGGTRAAGAETIEHIIVVVQENRSFDEYFGTYPGAEGIPRRQNGTFAVCIPDPSLGHLREAVPRQEPPSIGAVLTTSRLRGWM